MQQEIKNNLGDSQRMKGAGVCLDNHRRPTRRERMRHQKGTEISEKNKPQIASEKGQTQKSTYCMTPSVLNVHKSKSIETADRLMVPRAGVGSGFNCK